MASNCLLKKATPTHTKKKNKEHKNHPKPKNKREKNKKTKTKRKKRAHEEANFFTQLFTQSFSQKFTRLLVKVLLVCYYSVVIRNLLVSWLFSLSLLWSFCVFPPKFLCCWDGGCVFFALCFVGECRLALWQRENPEPLEKRKKGNLEDSIF